MTSSDEELDHEMMSNSSVAEVDQDEFSQGEKFRVKCINCGDGGHEINSCEH